MKTRAKLLSLLLAIWLLPGCVQREMTITSDPPDADVLVNEEWHGRTPFKMPFKHYGTYGVRLEKAGYYPLYVKEKIAAPFYQKIGPDLIAEAAIPATINDRREMHYVLQKVEESDDVAGIIERAETLAANSEILLERRNIYDSRRQSRDLPFLPEKRPQSSVEKKRRPVIMPTEPRPASELRDLPPLEATVD